MNNKDIKLTNAHIMFGDAMNRLKELPDNSIDSIVTDAPYGLSDNKYVADTILRWVNGERSFIPDGKGFMGKAWDSFVPPPAIWDECLRVLKPGGHLLAFFGSRTQDIGALSIRLAGFEIRDSIAWLYGSGFPKSLDISKAIDKQSGVKRKVVGEKRVGIKDGAAGGSHNSGMKNQFVQITEPSTDDAKKWNGWGTALKPAVEPIVVARKPLSEKTVANNVLKWGTGGLNIDASRIGTEEITVKGGSKSGNGFTFVSNYAEVNTEHTGRFPANIILDEEAASMLDEQSGVLTSGGGNKATKNADTFLGTGFGGTDDTVWKKDTGGASRFFYVAKASKKDRNEGLEELEAKTPKFGNQVIEVEEGSVNDKFRTQPKTNFHPTVKPTKLMEYLVKLVTPIGGTVLDPFTGSGSTGKAALLNGFKFVGCELTEEYLPIIEGRLTWAENKYNETQKDKETEQSETLFEIEGGN